MTFPASSSGTVKAASTVQRPHQSVFRRTCKGLEVCVHICALSSTSRDCFGHAERAKLLAWHHTSLQSDGMGGFLIENDGCTQCCKDQLCKKLGEGSTWPHNGGTRSQVNCRVSHLANEQRPVLLGGKVII